MRCLSLLGPLLCITLGHAGPAHARCPMGQCDAGGSSTTPAVSALKDQVLGLLHEQVAAWNRGDLEGYMSGYWRSPELTFYAGGTVTTGWQPTLERYRRKYQAKGASMGQLAFQDLSVVMLTGEAALARGKWVLTFPPGAGQSPRGLFTVLVRRLPEGWRVVHDHSSAE